MGIKEVLECVRNWDHEAWKWWKRGLGWELWGRNESGITNQAQNTQSGTWVLYYITTQSHSKLSPQIAPRGNRFGPRPIIVLEKHYIMDQYPNFQTRDTCFII